MKAMKLTAQRQMQMQEVPRPSLSRDTDVLIKMACVGVCGSDVHYFAEGGIGSQRVEYPWTVGHEGTGTVVEVGTAVTRVKPGDRIALDPAQRLLPWPTSWGSRSMPSRPIIPWTDWSVA